MANANDTDEFLVNRSDKTYTIQTQNIMADLLDNDLMLINRSDKTYKITGAELKASLVPPGEIANINSIVLTELNPNQLPRFTDQKFNITVVMNNQGNPPALKKIEATVVGDITSFTRFNEPLIATSTTTTPDYTTGASFDLPMVRGSVERFFTIDNNNHAQTQAIGVGPDVIEEVVLTLANPITVKDKLVLIYGNVGAQQPESLGGSFRWYGRLSSSDPWIQGNEFVSTAGDSADKYDWPGRLDLTSQLPSNKTITEIRFGLDRYPGKPTAGAYIYPGALEVDGLILESNQPSVELVFSSNAWMKPLEVADTVTQNTTSGFVSEINEAATRIRVLRSTDDWILGAPVLGPPRLVSEQNATKYLKFNSAGVVEGLLRFPQDPPYETTEQTPSLTLTFPSVFENGRTPDTELSPGTSLTATVTATNDSGTAGPLSDTVVPDGDGADLSDVFATTLYTGIYTSGGGGQQTITTGINQNEALLWLRGRSGGTAMNYVHRWHDSERNPSAAGRYIESNSNNPEGDAAQSVTDLFNGGFDVGSSGTVNLANAPYVAWSFRKNARFFDIVTYTGDSQAARQIGHNLGSKPGMILIKSLDGGPDSWVVYHKDSGNVNGTAVEIFGSLDTANEFTPDGGIAGSQFFNVWQSTEPTSSVFMLGANSIVNGAGRKFVAYLFASEAGGFGPSGTQQVIKCGSYQATGTSQFVETGFQPNFLLIKAVNAPQPWYLSDSVRGWDNPILANSTGAEGTEVTGNVTPTSNGFNLAGSQSETNASNIKYCYLAIA